MTLQPLGENGTEPSKFDQILMDKLTTLEVEVHLLKKKNERLECEVERLRDHIRSKEARF